MMKRMRIYLTAGIVACGLGVVGITQNKVVGDEPAVSNGNEVNVVFTDSDESDGKETEKSEGSEAADEVKSSSQSVRVEIHSSSEASDEDGKEPKVKVSGKVVVVGPDGSKKEYDLNDKEAQEFILQDEEGKDGKDVKKVIIMKEGFRISNESSEDKESGEDKEKTEEEVAEEERYVIGVQCEDASDLLRTHLKLGDKGVVILEVRDETPAAEAGLKVNDIIVSIGDSDLHSREDLISAVLESEGKELNLSLIRAGVPQTLVVTPKLMKVPVVVAPAGFDVELKDLTEPGKQAIRLRRVHPGLMLEGHLPHDRDSLNKLLEHLREAAGEDTERDMERDIEVEVKEKDVHHDLEAVHEQLRELKEQMRELQEQLKEKTEAE